MYKKTADAIFFVPNLFSMQVECDRNYIFYVIQLLNTFSFEFSLTNDTFEVYKH